MGAGIESKIARADRTGVGKAAGIDDQVTTLRQINNAASGLHTPAAIERERRPAFERRNGKAFAKVIQNPNGTAIDGDAADNEKGFLVDDVRGTARFDADSEVAGNGRDADRLLQCEPSGIDERLVGVRVRQGAAEGEEARPGFCERSVSRDPVIYEQREAGTIRAN